MNQYTAGWIKCEWEIPKGHKESFVFRGKSVLIEVGVDGDRQQHGVYVRRIGMWSKDELRAYTTWIDRSMNTLKEHAFLASQKQ